MKYFFKKLVKLALNYSGSGKTTLLNALFGQVPVTAGDIIANGIPVTKATRRKMCYVMQQDVFFPHPSLWDTIMVTKNSNFIIK